VVVWKLLSSKLGTWTLAHATTRLTLTARRPSRVWVVADA
jgi:hypothetical protein